MFKQVRSGWPKAIWSIQNSVNPGPTLPQAGALTFPYLILLAWCSQKSSEQKLGPCLICAETWAEYKKASTNSFSFFFLQGATPPSAAANQDTLSCDKLCQRNLSLSLNSRARLNRRNSIECVHLILPLFLPRLYRKAPLILSSHTLRENVTVENGFSGLTNYFS